MVIEEEGKTMIKIVLKNLKELKHDKTNPNKMSTTKLDALCRSIEKHGELQPVIIDQNNKIIDGHHRAEAYRLLQKNKVPCIIIPVKNQAQRALIRQSMNKIRGTHDEEMDAEEIKKILQSIDLEEFTGLIGETEQNVLNIINKIEKEETELKKKVEFQAEVKEVTCPKCGHKFIP